MRKTVYLHVGPHKTGTTVIQKACLDNKSVLDKYSLSYPDIFFEALGHHKLVNVVRRRDTLDSEVELIANSSNKILLSSENFIHFTLQDLKYLKQCLSQFDVKVIYAWRRSSLKMYSMWQESVKHGNTQPFHSFFYNDLIRPGQSRSLMQRLNVELYASVFGEDNLHILDFDALSESNSLVEEFFNLIGVDGSEIDVSRQSQGIKNESLDPATTEILRCLNSLSCQAGLPQNSKTREAFSRDKDLVSEEIEKIKSLMHGYYEELEVGDYFVDRATEKILTEKYSENLIKYNNKKRRKTIKVVNQDWMLNQKSVGLIMDMHKKIMGDILMTC